MTNDPNPGRSTQSGPVSEPEVRLMGPFPTLAGGLGSSAEAATESVGPIDAVDVLDRIKSMRGGPELLEQVPELGSPWNWAAVAYVAACGSSGSARYISVDSPAGVSMVKDRPELYVAGPEDGNYSYTRIVCWFHTPPSPSVGRYVCTVRLQGPRGLYPDTIVRCSLNDSPIGEPFVVPSEEATLWPFPMTLEGGWDWGFAIHVPVGPGGLRFFGLTVMRLPEAAELAPV